MQPMSRRVGDRSTWNTLVRGLNYHGNPASGSRLLSDCRPMHLNERVDVVGKSLRHFSSRNSSEFRWTSTVETTKDGNLEFLQRQHVGSGPIWKVGQRCGATAVAHVLERSHAAVCGLPLKNGLSEARSAEASPIASVKIRAIFAEVVGNCILNGVSRMRFSPFGSLYRTGRVNSLHTEVKGERSANDRSEEVTAVGSVMLTVPSGKEKAILKSTNHDSVEERKTDFVSTGADYEVNEEAHNELVMKAESILHQEDAHEETDKFPLAHGSVVEQLPPSPSESRYEVHNTGKSVFSGSASAQALAILRAALDEAEEDDGRVEEEFQRSLRVGIVGAPNAGKSLLTNQLVGTRVSAVSRKTNTTHREHLGVFTKGDTQLLYYDTPGLHLDIEGSPLRVEAQHRVRNAWQIVDFCEALVVLVDAERQIRRPDQRVKRLVEKLGSEQMISQKRILCLNKVDIIEQKKLLLPLAKEFEDLRGYDRIFMISGLTGSGAKDITDYLVDQAVLRPWDEDPVVTDHRDIALEIVREQVFEHLHEELPHTTKQKLVSWKILKDGSVRIQQLLLVAKKEHQKILVGKNGAVIGEIGIKARKELQNILGVTVHLVLDVKPMPGAE